jgi:hypothetical protein
MYELFLETWEEEGLSIIPKNNRGYHSPLLHHLVRAT